jgi:integrase
VIPASPDVCGMSEGSDPLTLYRGWRADLHRYKSPDQARLYSRSALAALADLELGILDVTKPQLVIYLEQLRPSVAKLYRQALRDWFDWLVQHGHRSSNPIEGTAPPPRRVRGFTIRRALDPDEFQRLLKQADQGCADPRYGPARRRLALLIRLQTLTGLRPGELCQLRVDEVHLTYRPRIEVNGRKTGDWREVPLTETGVQILRELITDRQGLVAGLKVRTYCEAVATLARRAGISHAKARSYALRHTFASNLIDAGVHLRIVGQLMGHRDPRSTMAYTVQDYPRLLAALEQVAS